MSQIYHDGEEKPWSISALPDFAQIYSFLQCFGHLLYLPRITLGELEEFFLRGYTSLEDPVVLVHWRLLNNVCKKVGRGEWQRAAIKFGRRHSLWRESVPYGELSIRQRMRLLRLTCEEQFDLNGSFKERMKKELLPTSLQSEPFGVDRDGQRHWLLKDSVFDLRLFGESEYDTVYSPERATWVELARSVDDLSIYIAKLESRWPSERSGKGPSSCRSDETSLLGLPLCAEYPLKNVYEDVGCEEEGGRVSHTSTGKEKEETGCLKCKKDTNYKQLLLCDGCDRECHTYCQYPILWNIPNGKWYCPLCKEVSAPRMVGVWYCPLCKEVSAPRMVGVWYCPLCKEVSAPHMVGVWYCPLCKEVSAPHMVGVWYCPLCTVKPLNRSITYSEEEVYS